MPFTNTNLPLSIKEERRLRGIVVQVHSRGPGIIGVWHVVEVEESLSVTAHHSASKLIIERILFIIDNVCCFLILICNSEN